MAQDQQPIDAKIDQVNQRLKAAQLGLQVERRGQKLSLRGILPPRRESDRLRPHQQRLGLNLPATPAGLKLAEQEAKIIAAQLIQNVFDWRNYETIGGKRLNQMDLAEKLKAFEAHFLGRRSSSPGPQNVKAAASALTTWRTAYAPYLRKLELTAQSRTQLSLPEAIYATVRATTENSRSRQACCTALSALAEFLNLELPKDLKTLWGTYGPGQAESRNLPTDEQILDTLEQIPNPAWRFVYAIMATYGLRNHEVFFCDYASLVAGEPSIKVLDSTKAGSHEVWPFYPEWVEQFDLRQICLPPVETDLSRTTLQRIGQQVTIQFKRYNLPFSPYNLRHAWAVRTIHFGLSDSVAARMMGHSVAVHTRTYHQWLTRRDQQQAVETALQRSTLTAPGRAVAL